MDRPPLESCTSGTTQLLLLCSRYEFRMNVGDLRHFDTPFVCIHNKHPPFLPPSLPPFRPSSLPFPLPPFPPPYLPPSLPHTLSPSLKQLQLDSTSVFHADVLCGQLPANSSKTITVYFTPHKPIPHCKKVTCLVHHQVWSR